MNSVDSSTSSLLENTISHAAYWQVNKAIAKALGSIEAAALLSDLIAKRKYFRERGQLDEKGGFFNTADYIEDSLCLSKERRQKLTKLLESRRLLRVIKKGMPSKNYYYLNDEAITELLSQSAGNPTHLSAGKPSHMSAGNPATNKNRDTKHKKKKEEAPSTSKKMKTTPGDDSPGVESRYTIASGTRDDEDFKAKKDDLIFRCNRLLRHKDYLTPAEIDKYYGFLVMLEKNELPIPSQIKQWMDGPETTILGKLRRQEDEAADSAKQDLELVILVTNKIDEELQREAFITKYADARGGRDQAIEWFDLAVNAFEKSKETLRDVVERVLDRPGAFAELERRDAVARHQAEEDAADERWARAADKSSQKGMADAPQVALPDQRPQVSVEPKARTAALLGARPQIQRPIGGNDGHKFSSLGESTSVAVAHGVTVVKAAKPASPRQTYRPQPSPEAKARTAALLARSK